MNASSPYPALLAAALTCSGAAPEAAHPEPMPIACNRHALSAAERSRHAELLGHLRAAIAEKQELPDGVALRVDASRTPLTEVAEWASLERRCCPFLRFELTLEAASGPTWLKLTGPEGAKAVLLSAMSE